MAHEDMPCDQKAMDLQLSGFRPTTPALSNRYESSRQSKPRNVLIKPGLFSYAGESEPAYLPLGWSPYTQPEGQLYFACETGFRFVTDAYMHHSKTLDRVMRFSVKLLKVLDAAQVILPTTIEVYLMPYSEEECGYYLVDHASHTVSWLEEVDLDQLAIADVVSDSHLRFALEDLYWQHIEQFPSHRLSSLSMAVDDLIAAFLHGEADHLTSANSTFPYVAKECKHFVRVLESAKQKLDQPASICIVARLWSVVARHRLQVHYAQERARLSREQQIIALPETNRGLLFAGISKMMFDIPQAYAKKLDRLFSDEIVFVHPWRDFMRGSREEWQQYLTWSLGLAILNVLCLGLSSPASQIIAQISLACCAMTLLSSLALLVRFHDAHQWIAATAATYLIACGEASPGFRRPALAFSAPKAAFVWAACVASLQPLLWLERATNIYALAALVGLVLLISMPWSRWARKAYLALPRWRRRGAEKPEGAIQV